MNQIKYHDIAILKAFTRDSTRIKIGLFLVDDLVLVLLFSKIVLLMPQHE